MFDYGLGLGYGNKRAIVDPLGELPSPPALGSEPVRKSSLGQGGYISEGVETEPVKATFRSADRGSRLTE